MKDVRARLKSAVAAQGVPEHLDSSIRQRIQAHEEKERRRRIWFGVFAFAGATAGLLAVGLWVRPQVGPPLPSLEDERSQAAYIARISATISPVMKVGLGDHLHCAVFCRYPAKPPTADELGRMIEPRWKDLLPLMARAVPSSYEMMSAHRCTYGEREFVHLVFRKGSSLLSLVITERRPGETLPDSVLDITTAGYSLAGFNAGGYLAFIASEEPSSVNTKIAVAAATSLRRFIANSLG